MALKPLPGSAGPNGSEVSPAEATPTNTRAEEQDDKPLSTPLRAISTLSNGREFVQLEPDHRQLFIKTVTPELPYALLEAHCAQVPGFSHLILSDPNPVKKFYRFGWICFDNTDDIAEAEKVLAESTVDSFTLHLQHNTTAIKLRTLIAPGLVNTVERIAKDLEQVRKVVARFEDDAGEPGGSHAIEARHQTELGRLADQEESLGHEGHRNALDSLVSTRLLIVHCFEPGADG